MESKSMFKLPLIAAVLSILAALLGVFLGIQTVKLERKSNLQTVAEWRLANNVKPDVQVVRDKLPKAEIIGEVSKDFGHIGYQDTTRVKYQIKNVGGSDLRIDYRGNVSCGLCTWLEIPTSDFPEGVKNAPESQTSLIVAPGATATVSVGYTPKNKSYTPRISEWAKIHLNDPELKDVELTITGSVTKAYRLTNDKFALADLTVGHAHESRVGVFGFNSEKPLKLDKVEFLTEVRETDFTVRIEPMPEELVKAEPGAVNGYEIILTAVKPPLGRIAHQLRLHVANAEPPTVDLDITGNVIGNIEFVLLSANPNIKWIRGPNFLDWGVVDGKKGDEVTMHIRAKMPADSPFIKFKVKETYPTFIQAEIGESTRGSNAQVAPLKIRIPPGAEPVNFRSLSVNSKAAQVVLETDDPSKPEIVVGLRFGVE
jgi:hypothetical protein